MHDRPARYVRFIVMDKTIRPGRGRRARGPSMSGSSVVARGLGPGRSGAVGEAVRGPSMSGSSVIARAASGRAEPVVGFGGLDRAEGRGQVCPVYREQTLRSGRPASATGRGIGGDAGGRIGVRDDGDQDRGRMGREGPWRVRSDVGRRTGRSDVPARRGPQERSWAISGMGADPRAFGAGRGERSAGRRGGVGGRRSRRSGRGGPSRSTGSRSPGR